MNIISKITIFIRICPCRSGLRPPVRIPWPTGPCPVPSDNPHRNRAKFNPLRYFQGKPNPEHWPYAQVDARHISTFWPRSTQDHFYPMEYPIKKASFAACQIFPTYRSYSALQKRHGSFESPAKTGPRGHGLPYRIQSVTKQYHGLCRRWEAHSRLSLFSDSNRLESITKPYRPPLRENWPQKINTGPDRPKMKKQREDFWPEGQEYSPTRYQREPTGVHFVLKG